MQNSAFTFADTQISLDLLYDMYNEGRQVHGEAFNTKKSKLLTVRNDVKPEFMAMIDQILKQIVPDINILEVCYNLLYLNCIENYRKLTNVLNAINSVQRRITYDLLRIRTTLAPSLYPPLAFSLSFPQLGRPRSRSSSRSRARSLCRPRGRAGALCAARSTGFFRCAV